MHEDVDAKGQIAFTAVLGLGLSKRCRQVHPPTLRNVGQTTLRPSAPLFTVAGLMYNAKQDDVLLGLAPDEEESMLCDCQHHVIKVVSERQNMLSLSPAIPYTLMYASSHELGAFRVLTKSHGTAFASQDGNQKDEDEEEENQAWCSMIAH